MMKPSLKTLLTATSATILIVGAGYFMAFGSRTDIDSISTAATHADGSVGDIMTVSAQDEVLAKRLASALESADAGDKAGLDALRNTFAMHTLERDALDWALATSTKRAKMLTPSEIGAIGERLAHWPAADAIATSREVAMLDGPIDGLFGGLLGGTQLALTIGTIEPKTISGKIAVAKHQMVLGRKDEARTLIAPLWHTSTLWPALEQSIPIDFSDILTVEDHRKRLFNMMVRDRVRSAERFADMADMRPLFDAWSAIIRNQNGVADLIAALDPALLETPHGIYMRVEYARKRQLLDEAAALLLTLPADADALINPNAWWNERRIVSRSLREQGDHKTAYAIANAHSGGTATTVVDAAFHAGWYALRGLKDADKAKRHFDRILTVATGASSRSRAHYWLAQTHKATQQNAEAQQQLNAAAVHNTTYYGQLAAAELGKAITLVGSLHDQTDQRIALRKAPVRAALLLAQAGDAQGTVRLITGLADTTDDPAIITAMIDMFNQQGLHFAALRLAKRAAWIDRDIGQATHPVGALPLDATGNRADLALAYAIARQESEFRLDAVSSADARGLLQLLPSTARGVAQRLDVPFQASRLTTDAAYNTQLGTQYLAEQLERFEGSYVLTFIAYNAGPGRAREWIARFGDPRGLPLADLIDWVEQIPFPETRNYVQKVMENLIVYKAKLGLQPDIANDLRAGRTT